MHAKSKHTPLTLPEEYIPGAGFDVSILALSQPNSPNTVRYSPNTVRYSPATVRFVTMQIHQSLFVDKTDIFRSISIYVSFTFVGFQVVSEPDPHVHSGSGTVFRSTIVRMEHSQSSMPVAYGVVQICEELTELVVMLGLLLQSVSHFAGLQFCLHDSCPCELGTSSLSKSWVGDSPA